MLNTKIFKWKQFAYNHRFDICIHRFDINNDVPLLRSIYAFKLYLEIIEMGYVSNQVYIYKYIYNVIVDI